VTTFRLNDPDVIENPYPHYEWLREHAPVYHDRSLDLWIVSRHEDVVIALRDARRFRSNSGRGMLSGNPSNPASRFQRWLGAVLERGPTPRVLLTSDPPDHTVLRRKVIRAFTPAAIGVWEPRIRGITERLIDEISIMKAPVIDLVDAFSSPLPTAVIAEIMGVPTERQAEFKRWSDQLVTGLLTRGNVARMLSATAALSAFFARTVRQRRRRQGDDLVSLLVAGDAQDRLTTLELVVFCVLLLVAGNETTTNLISNTMLALFERPQLWRKLKDDPGLAAAAVEETLRFDGPGQGPMRYTSTEVTLSGTTIPRGATVLALIASANRDPRRWAEPDEFRLDRGHIDHLGFGHGIHFCCGHALARLEARSAIEAIFRRLATMRRAGTPERIASPVLRGLRTLPVSLAPTADSARLIGDNA
jgi:cytochrome P450